MRVSVILSTYEQPAWLEKVLWGYAHQSHGEFEIVVADDGSGSETREVIDCCRRKLGLAIEHVWQPHDGFRKCRILNDAIARSDGDYLIFSDGDCVPRRDFVATHVAHARPRVFLSGGVLRLPLALSTSIGANDIATGRAFAWQRLVVGGCKFWRLRFAAAPRWAATCCDLITPTRASFNGHNSSAWRSDIERVNGFDERMQYGGLDRELGERMINAGVRTRQIRHRAICLHLDHLRDYLDPKARARNQEIRRATRQNCATWTNYGLISRERTGEPVILPFSEAARFERKHRIAA
jgi:cellulose synthase/poly-beta-1,6-N-acetylglucosamine synthase-like glycosyltransferase